MLYHVNVIDVHTLIVQDLPNQVQEVLFTGVLLFYLVEELTKEDVEDLSEVHQHLLLADVGGRGGLAADGDDGVGLVVVADQERVEFVAGVIFGV